MTASPADATARNGHPGPGASLLNPAEWTRISAYFRLSGRELQIAGRIFDDETEASIAANLGISPHTVHTHIERLYRKLSVSTRVGLVLRIVAQQMAVLRDQIPASATAPERPAAVAPARPAGVAA